MILWGITVGADAIVGAGINSHAPRRTAKLPGIPVHALAYDLLEKQFTTCPKLQVLSDGQCLGDMNTILTLIGAS